MKKDVVGEERFTKSAIHYRSTSDCNAVPLPLCHVTIVFFTVCILLVLTGRARRKDSQYCILGDESRGNLAKESQHLVAERLMNQAVETFRSLMAANPNHFRTEMRQRQKNELEERRRESATKKMLEEERRVEVEGALFNLLCRKCQTVACCSSDIRRFAKDTHLVVALSFRHRWKRGANKRPNQVFQNLEIVGKLLCQACSFDWGCVARYLPTSTDFPAVKLEGFILEDARSKQKVSKTVPWKVAPFDVKRISEDELANIRL